MKTLLSRNENMSHTVFTFINPPCFMCPLRTPKEQKFRLTTIDENSRKFVKGPSIKRYLRSLDD